MAPAAARPRARNGPFGSTSGGGWPFRTFVGRRSMTASDERLGERRHGRSCTATSMHAISGSPDVRVTRRSKEVVGMVPWLIAAVVFAHGVGHSMGIVQATNLA